MQIPKVLLVDQDNDSVAIYTMMLEHHGYQVLHASGPLEAFGLVMRERPHVVVTEIHRGWADGVHVTQLLRREEETAGIPVIAVTSLPVRPGSAAEALALCNGVLPKPCIPSRLLDEVERLAGARMTVPQTA